MNIALIFAAGRGKRAGKSVPKQFLLIERKPILIRTLEKFQLSNLIDEIFLVTLDEYFDETRRMLEQWSITKCKQLIVGGETGLDSIFNGLMAISSEYPNENPVVLIHDGVRPFIDSHTIEKNIELVRLKGNCVTVSPAIETVVIADEKFQTISKVVDRKYCLMAKAPQSFFLKTLIPLFKEAKELGLNRFVDTASLVSNFGLQTYTLIGPNENIKITTPEDLICAKALIKEKENGK